MPIYIMLSRLTDHGRQPLLERTERIVEVNQEIEGMGARVIEQWAVLGSYDFVNVVEAPDTETIGRVSVVLGARGTIQFLTMPAIPIEAFISGIKGEQASRSSSVRFPSVRQHEGRWDTGPQIASLLELLSELLGQADHYDTVRAPPPAA